MTDPFDGIPRKHFRVVLADPPWNFKGYSKKGEAKAPQAHYRTMSLADIKALPVADLAAKDCHLFLWTTWPHLPQALDVMAAWGFKYSGSGFVWTKLRRGFRLSQLQIAPSVDSLYHFGLGLTTRKNSEPCLLGRRGSPRRLSASVRELIHSPAREHSRKPDEAHERIETYAEGPYLELFARETRPGWTTWGNEATKFDKREGAEPWER